MKKILLFALCLLLGLSARGQVFIINDNLMTGRMSEIKATVLDSLTNEPVGFASVYVIPSKDTTITNFTLSDAKGEAKLDEVPYGSYVFHVEMMGYKPFIKEKYFRERRVDMGTIRLQVDEHYLEAAVVSDVGNPIVVKKDTVEFNASSFRVGANAMLKDLLQRMPGMVITEDGKVKFNGEEIDKLTIGGRTFFFNDQSTALNNLPAAVVDKIRVIDRDSEATRASGLQDGSREKVLDVALKKEYEKGWFGNAGVKGGSTLTPKADEKDLRDGRGFLWSGNALVSAYGEKDQVTVIGNAQNINDSNAVFIMIDGDGERSSLNQGLSTAAQLGVNANTSRIKDVETAVSANYKYTDTRSGNKTERTTFQDSGNLNASSLNTGRSYNNSVSANMEFKKEKSKVWFHLRPDFRYSKTDSYSNGSSQTLQAGNFLNSAENANHSLSASKNAYLNGDVTFREIGGKAKRSLTLGLSGSYGDNKGESDEASLLTLNAETSTRTMHYDANGRNGGARGDVSYTEPLGEKWTLGVRAGLYWTGRSSVRDAFDAAGKNDYYSSVSRNNYLEQTYGLTAQFQFAERSYITLGANVLGILNETFSKSFGIENTTGKGEWLWHVMPQFRFIYGKGNHRLSVYVAGSAQQPSSARIQPVLNITDPSRLSLGNVYLKPYTQTYLNADWVLNNRERFSTLMLYFYGHVSSSPIISAQWYDADGIMYSVPVNAKKPSLTANLTANYTTPLDSRKLWSLTLGGTASFNAATSYQTRQTLSGLDKDSFDYSAFMADFWGTSGERFYSGESGFEESKTNVFSPYVSFSVKFNPNHYSFSIGASTQGRIARYSLDPRANMNTLDTRLTARGSYTTKHEFEFLTDISYVFYKGYQAGYGQPEWQWNAEISKNIGAFNLSLKVHDILNQTRNLTHTVTANYMEDSYRLIMGRYLLLGVKWNFGKMNAAHSRRAQQAAWNMVW